MFVVCMQMAIDNAWIRGQRERNVMYVSKGHMHAYH